MDDPGSLASLRSQCTETHSLPHTLIMNLGMRSQSTFGGEAHLGCSAWASLVATCRLSCPEACGIFVPRPWIELTSPALEGGFITTGSPGKSLSLLLILAFLWVFTHFPLFICLHPGLGSSITVFILDSLFLFANLVPDPDLVPNNGLGAVCLSHLGRQLGWGVSSKRVGGAQEDTDSLSTAYTSRTLHNLHVCQQPSVAQSCLPLCDPMDCTCRASVSFTVSWSLFKFMSIESVMASNHLILCCSLFLLLSIFPSIRVSSNELVLHIRWPKYWSFSFSRVMVN